MEFPIYLVTQADVIAVSKIAGGIPGVVKVTINSEGFEIDARSLMGIYSLNLSDPVTLKMSSDYEVNYDYYKSLFTKWITEEKAHEDS